MENLGLDLGGSWTDLDGSWTVLALTLDGDIKYKVKLYEQCDLFVLMMINIVLHYKEVKI